MPYYPWLKKLFDLSPRPTKVLDLTQRIVLWNRAAEEAYGWSESEMVGLRPPFRGFLPEAYLAQWEASVEQALTTGRVVERQMSHRCRRDGTIVDVDLAMRPLPSVGGEVVGVIITHLNVTERTRFLQIATHELHNPLASIKGIVSLLGRRLKDGRSMEDAQALIEAAAGEVDRLGRMLDEILEGFRVADRQFDVRVEPIDLAALLAATVAAVKTSEQTHEVWFETDGQPARVLGDARRLDEVMRNLLSNARKYSPDGTEIRVGLRRSATAARVTVRDQGRGIPEDDLSRIFEAFYRSPAVAGPDPGGLGLGLYLCWDIIGRHQGRIWAENNPGGGASVSFKLPLMAAP